MDPEKRKALEAAGWRFGDADDFLELTEEERRLVDLKVALSRAIRRRREGRNLTQQQVARRLGSSQSRVAKIEMAAAGVSLDLMFRGLFAVGGSLADLSPPAAPPGRNKGPRARKAPPADRPARAGGATE